MLLAKVTPCRCRLAAGGQPAVHRVGYRQMGRAFALRSALAIAGLAVVLATVHFPDVTPDLLLTAVFGGFFIGAGIGLAVRGGAVLDGTEIAALLISKRSHLLKVGDVILVFNVGCSWPRCACSASSRRSIRSSPMSRRRGRWISSSTASRSSPRSRSCRARASAIREGITGELGRGVTVYKGYGGLSGAEQQILFCVVTRLEIGKVKAIVRALDEHAFIVSHALADAEGGVVKRTALH